MNLDYSDEQRLLKDSVDRFITQRYSYAQRARILQTPARFDPQVWQQLAEFGWLALPLPSQHGGLDGTAVDVGILMEGFGRGLLLEPYLSTVVLCGRLIAAAGTPAQQAQWLPAIAAGQTRLAFAHGEDGSQGDVASIRMQARPAAAGWVLEGRKTLVLDAPGASHFIVSAQTGDGRAPMRLFLLPRDHNGIQEKQIELVDGRLASHLDFQRVEVSHDMVLGGGADCAPVIEQVIDFAIAALSAESVGAMRVLLAATVEYTKQRVQFGQPLSANQVLRHRMVDMAVCCEEAAAIALLAALRSDAQVATRARAASGAKIKISDAGRFVAEQAVQLHGAMGVTDELNIGAYFKRLMTFDMLFGTPSHHLDRRIALDRRIGLDRDPADAAA